jgi:hypothetical protein
MGQILGSFEAKKPNPWSADVLYSVVVGADRLVARAVGGQFSGAEPMWGRHLGLIGMLIDHWARKRHERKRSERDAALEGTDLDRILAENRKNFALHYYELKVVRLAKRSVWAQMMWRGPGTLILEPQRGKPVKLVLQNPAQLALCVDLLGKAMPGVVRIDPALELERRVA